jgi:hypothetical protein
VLNLECPAAIQPDVAAVMHSNQPKLDAALVAAGMRSIYSIYGGLDLVAMLFGGIIPTDIQGVYRGGTPAVTTAVDYPYYHTVRDTPDTVDLQLLAASTDGFDDAITNIDKLSADDLNVADPTLWTTAAVLAPGGIGAQVTIRDGKGVPQAGITVRASYLVDDFTLADRGEAVTDANGVATVMVQTTDKSHPNNFLHVTAGPSYPLVETILPVN